MLFVFAALGAWMLALTGLGSLVRREVRHDLRDKPLGPADALAGLLVLGLVGTLANFVLPLNASFAWMLLLAGAVAAAVVSARASSVSSGVGGLRVLAPHLGFAAGCAALLTHRAAYLDDIGAYQLPNVLWSMAGPIPRGLANLNPRMGFNSEWFVLDAITRSPGDGVGPSLVTALGAWIVVWALWRLMRRPAASWRPLVLLALLPLALTTPALRVGFNAPATDAPVLLAWIGLAVVLLALDEGAIALRDATLLTSAVALVAITAKVSAAPMAIVPALLAWRTRDRALAIGLLCAGSVAVGAWLLRGIWTSGCAVFPVAATCVPGPTWLADAGSVAAESENVRNWARMPYWTPEGLASGTWVRTWWLRQLTSVELLGPVALMLTGWLAVKLGARKSHLSDGTRLMGLTAIAQIVFVGVTAPDARFATGAMWAFALLFASARLVSIPRAARPMLRLAPLAPLALLAPFVVDAAAHYSRGIRHVADAPPAFIRPAVTATGVAARVERFSDGTEVRVPAVGIACWATELPCTARGWFVPGTRVTRDARGRIVMFEKPSTP